MAENSNPQDQNTTSGISVDPLTGDFGLTSTVTLSRKGMGIGARSRENTPMPHEHASEFLLSIVQISTVFGTHNSHASYFFFWVLLSSASSDSYSS